MMGLSYKISDKELLEVRNKIFLERGAPALEEKGFQKSPFPNSWYGKDDIGGYTYELCRLNNKSHLQIVTGLIVKGDRWIQVYLNIFELHPQPKSLQELKKKDGIKFYLPPNSLTKMRLKVDDIKGIPLFSYSFMFGGHKLKSFNSESGMKKRVKQLGDLIEKDLSKIDSFIERWHELHQPNVTDWEGNKIKQ